MVEEGQPDFIEQNLHAILRKAGLQTRAARQGHAADGGRIHRRRCCVTGVDEFLERHARTAVEPPAPRGDGAAMLRAPCAPEVAHGEVHARPPGFCTGCPERPIFTAMKLVERELGPHHVSCDIGCHLFSILPPFNIGNTTMGYGLGCGRRRGVQCAASGKRAHRRVMGDGGFWHNGLTCGVGNAVFNQSDNVLVVVDNGYSAATGGQDILSSRRGQPRRSTKHAIARGGARRRASNGCASLDRTYDVDAMRDALREALTTQRAGPRSSSPQSECMLNRQRREQPAAAMAIAAGARVVRERFGVDADTCTGDHSCIRLSGCPSLTIKPNPDPLRQDPVAHVDNQLRRLRAVRRGRACRGAVPVVLPRRPRLQPRHAGIAGSPLRGAVIGWLQRRANGAPRA